MRVMVYALSTLLLLCGCETTVNSPLDALPPTELSISIPQEMRSGESAQWLATWQNGRAPFTVRWDFGGGAEQDTVTQEVSLAETSLELQMLNAEAQDAAFICSVTITDDGERSAMATLTYTVQPAVNSTPVLGSSTYDAGSRTLTVSVSDPDGDDLTVSVTQPEGLVASPSSVNVPGGSGTAEFHWNSTDIFSEASGTTTVSIDDSRGGLLTETALITAGFTPIVADALYVLPLLARIETGEPVTIVVATSDPADPFQFLSAVGVTVESDAAYVPVSFNIGTPGGEQFAADGAWAQMAPEGGFGQFFDMPIEGTSIGGGRQRYDFAVTPIEGTDMPTIEGALFSFQLTFSEPGLKTLGFQLNDGANDRTYYQDSTLTKSYWGDLSNEGVPNTITVE